MKRKYLCGIFIFLGMFLLMINGYITKVNPVQAKSKDFDIKDNVLQDYLGSDVVVTVPDGVTTIGENAFSESPQITKVILPNSVTRINWGAFQNCAKLESVTLPKGLTNLSNNVFQGCSSLWDIELPDTLISIGDSAFQDCSSLESIVIPEGVVLLGWYAFYGCTKLTEIEIPSSIKHVGFWTFEGTKWLTDYDKDELIINNLLVRYQGNKAKYVVPDFITTIVDGAFLANNSIEEVVLPKGLVIIGNGAFEECSKLKKINIPEGVTTVGSSAFYDCSSLAEISFPSSVMVFGEHILKGSAYFENYTEEFFIVNGILLDYLGQQPIVIIPGNVKEIAPKAFTDNAMIEKIIIPEGAIRMKGTCIFRCNSLQQIIIPESVIDIDEEAVLWCENDITIYGVSGSAAEEFSKLNSLKFVGYSLNKSEVTLYAGNTSNTVQLKVDGFKDEKEWNSGNEKVAQVSEGGLVTAKKAGTAYISTVINGLQLTCKVTVKAPALNRKTMILSAGKSVSLQLLGYSSGVVWKSSDPKIASVDKSGKVSAVKKGKATISAVVDGITYSCSITVTSAKK